VMYLGQFVEVASRDDLYQSPLHPYTQALLSAVPLPDPVRERTRQRIILRGDLPDPTAPPSGCRFHTRCWLREELGGPTQCEVDVPELRSVGGRQVRCHFAEESLNRGTAAGQP
jgi:peptide/nickel transport system ATP-binding protein